MNLTAWTPKSFLALRDYNGRKFGADLAAGVTVGLVALPLSMAFAIASGAPPEAGLYTAVVAGFAISALGGSRNQIGGPTGAFVVIIAGILARYGFNGLLLCTIMAGCLLILLGATGLGAAVKFIPRPVIVGFTNGIALLIASTQIKDFFGLHTGPVPGDFVGRMRVVLGNVGTLSLTATLLSCAGLLLIVLMIRFLPRIPGYIVALVAATAAVYFLHLPVETVGSRFGGIPSGFPRFHVPVFEYATMRTLISPAITVAMLGAIESLMSAVVADRMSGDQHNPNVELMAQGVANILSPLCGGLPATGAIARTATSIRCGAVSPVAGMVHALTVLAVLLFAAPLARFIPLAVLAAILMVVCSKMGEWHEIPQILRLSKLEIGVWLTTLLLTVFADLTVAVEGGMILAALVFIRKVTLTTTVTRVTEDDVEDGRVHVLQGKDIPSYVAIYRIHGPFLFGATEKIDEIRRRLPSLPPIVVLRLRNMTAIDSTGLQALQRLAEEVRGSGRTLLLCGAREQPARLMGQAAFAQHVGEENICAHVTAALVRANAIHEQGLAHEVVT
ncbi:MAG TPA: SulP family inorganic anion transporter [Acidobacteriaceae bacterium]|nr:SulP family inorganic anion transporter [Acidobacteriaceae bacterium]